MVAYARLGFGFEQPLASLYEDFCRLGGRVVARIDDRITAFESSFKPLTRPQIHTISGCAPAYDPHLVATRAQHIDNLRSEHPGSTNYRDPHADPPLASVSGLTL